MRSSVIVIRSVYFGAQKAEKIRKKNVGVNRSVYFVSCTCKIDLIASDLDLLKVILCTISFAIVL